MNLEDSAKFWAETLRTAIFGIAGAILAAVVLGPATRSLANLSVISERKL